MEGTPREGAGGRRKASAELGIRRAVSVRVLHERTSSAERFRSAHGADGELARRLRSKRVTRVTGHKRAEKQAT